VISYIYTHTLSYRHIIAHVALRSRDVRMTWTRKYF